MRGFHGKRSREAGAGAGRQLEGVHGAAENATDDIPLPGRYVSKRERLRMDGQKKNVSTSGQLIHKISEEIVTRETAAYGRGALPSAPHWKRHAGNETSHNAYGEGALPDVPDWIRHAAAEQEGAAAEQFVAPRRLMCRIQSAHSRPATCVRWSPQNGHLLTSAGMDGAVKVWSPFEESLGERADSVETFPLCPVRVFHGHRAAVKDSSWTNNATQLLTASLDATVRVADVESGATVAEVCQGGAMSVCRQNPFNPQIFTTGGDFRVGSVRFWDMRMLRGGSGTRRL
ncbi:unnamed protein product [Closterium sp. Naga37s-1]|nr:unnamed protein product [Closterium sp. Naga37s-1]